MWIQDAARDDLLNIIQYNRLSDRQINQINSVESLCSGSSELQFLWREDPRTWDKLPNIIILDPTKMKEFYAWVATYIPSIKPITSYCRVQSKDFIINSAHAKSTFKLGLMETVFIGLIIGEAATSALKNSNYNRLSMGDFSRTCSFAISKSIICYKSYKNIDEVLECWDKAQRLTGQKKPNINLSTINKIWNTVLSILNQVNTANNNEDSTDLFYQVISYEYINNKDNQSYVGNIFSKSFLNELQKSPREERVKQVERILERLSQESIPDESMRSFLGGYLVNQIAPGTFDHYKLLIPYLSKLPSIIIWYGLCAGLENDSKLRNFGYGIGRRILRDIFQEESAFYRPSCDIALDELEVLWKDIRSTNFPFNTSGDLIVEIFPLINCSMQSTEPEINSINKLKHIETNEINNLLVELENMTNSVDRINFEIRKIFNYNEKGNDRNKRKK